MKNDEQWWVLACVFAAVTFGFILMLVISLLPPGNPR